LIYNMLQTTHYYNLQIVIILNRWGGCGELLIFP
jgi:hypothetical protein